MRVYRDSLYLYRMDLCKLEFTICTSYCNWNLTSSIDEFILNIGPFFKTSWKLSFLCFLLFLVLRFVSYNIDLCILTSDGDMQVLFVIISRQFLCFFLVEICFTSWSCVIKFYTDILVLAIFIFYYFTAEHFIRNLFRHHLLRLF